MNHPQSTTDKLKDYFTQFFDNRFLRDFRSFSYYSKDNKIKQYAKNFRITEDTSAEHDNFINSIQIYKDGFSDVTAELYSCQNIQDFKNKTNKDFDNKYPNKIINRLFFDFDFDKSSKAKELKNKIRIDVANRETRSAYDKVMEYSNILLIKDKIALKPYHEMLRLYEHLENFNINSYPIFSGSKGFHLYIFFPETTEIEKDSINHLSTEIAEAYKESCSLETIDFAVNRDAYSRVSRLPYCRHPTTFLYTYPIDINDSYEEIIAKAVNPEIQKFKISNYKKSEGNKDLTKLLLEINEDYKKKKESYDKKKNEANKIREAKRLKKYNNKTFNNQNSIFSDCIKLAEVFLGEPIRNYGHYVTYKCPFHDDTNPSLTVYEKTFVCSCFGKMNYFEFIKKIKGFSTDNEVKNFMKENSKKKKTV